MFEKLSGNKSVYEPYKYIMQDTGSLYIGAKYSYEELLECEEFSFKMKAIISHYVLKDSDEKTTFESELYYLEKDSNLYKLFSQLKMKVKVQELQERKSLFGKKRTEYSEKVYSLSDLTNINLAKKKGGGMVVTEVIISKLALMTFTV